MESKAVTVAASTDFHFSWPCHNRLPLRGAGEWNAVIAATVTLCLQRNFTQSNCAAISHPPSTPATSFLCGN